MIILIDMDGVLCDFEKHMLDRFREKYPDEPFIKPEERRTFYLKEQYETKYGLGVSYQFFSCFFYNKAYLLIFGA